MKNLRKAIILGVMSVTVLSMSMIMVPMTVSAQAMAGDLIKMDGLASLYYLGADGKRYVFPNETTYFSWYSDFSGVVTVPQSELESYPLGANVTMRSGTSLVKITTDPKVYAVLPGGSLLWVPDEATALALYGANWAGLVVDVPDAFFTNYTVDAGQASDTAFPAGSLVKFGGGADVYYVNADGTASLVADEAAFAANRFNWGFVLESTMAVPTAGAGIAGADATLTDTSQGAGGTAGAGTGLTVSIASDTPASSNIPLGSPTDFLKVSLTAAADGDVTVNTLKLSAYELGTATNIDSVSIYLNGVKQGNAKNMNSDREATFNFATPIVIPAGTTITLLVKATINTTASNYAIGITAASDVATNGAVVSGSFPIVGNTKVVVTGGTIGTLTLSNVEGTDTAGVEFGESDVLLASFRLAAANEPVIWESLRLRNGGTNNDALATNLRLLVDGDELTTGTLVDRYTDFGTLNYVIAKSDQITVEVYGDIGLGNVGDTVILYLKEATDIISTGQDFGYGIALTGIALWNTTTLGKTITLASGDFSIAMDKSATPAKDVRAGDTNVVLATIQMASNGENATLADITNSGIGSDDFIISGTGLNCNEFDNVELYDVDSGALFDLAVTATTTAGNCPLTMSDEMSFVKGVVRTFELRADLDGSTDDNQIDNNDTLQVTLLSTALSGSITGDDSNANITNITPSSVSGAVMTVKASSLTWTTTALTSKTIVPGAQDVVVYKATLEAGDSSYIDLTTVRLDVQNDSGDYYGSFIDSNIASLDLYLDGKLLKSRANAITNDADTTDTDNYISFTTLDTANRRILAGATVNLELVADFAASFATTSTFDLTLDDNDSVVSKDVDSNAVTETVNNGGTASRALTLASVGTIKVELKVDDIKAASDVYILAGGETTKDRYMAELVFTTANEAVKVKTLKFDLSDNSGINAKNSDIKYLNLYDSDGVLVAQKAPDSSGDVDFSTFNHVFVADQATVLWVGITTKTINANGDSEGTATYNHGVEYTLGRTAAVTAEGVDSGTAINMSAASSATVGTDEYAAWQFATSSNVNITGSILNSVVNAMDDGVLTAGNSKIIGKYKFVFDNGTNRATSTNEETKAQIRELKITIATSSVTVTGNVKAYFEGLSSVKTAAGSEVAGLFTLDLDALTGDTENVDGEVTLVIIADLDGVTSNAFIQTEINDLTADFTYNGDSGIWPDHFSDSRLSISELQGAILSN